MKPTRERVLLLLFILTFPLVAYVSTLPAGRFRNEITEWGNKNSPAYQQYSDFRDRFGVNEFVVVSWPGCNLDDPRISKVTNRIKTELAGSVKQVSSGAQMYWELRDRAKLSEEAALKRLRGVMFGENDQTAIGFNLTEQGRANRWDVVKKLHEILEQSGVKPSEAFFAGLGHNLYTLDKEGLESPFRMVPQIMLLAFLLTLFFVRNIWLAFFINALGTYTGCLAFNFVELFGVDMNAIIWPLPTLTMLLTVSASLHFLSYFGQATEDFRNSNGLDTRLNSDAGPEPENPRSGSIHKFDLAQKRQIAFASRRSAIVPVACCTLTTAVGLLSLLLSTSEPVRQFGFFGSISILAANSLLLLWLPPFLTLMSHADKVELHNNQLSGSATDGWAVWKRFTHRFQWPIIIGSLTVLVVLAMGAGKIKTGSNLQNFFPSGHHVLEHADAIEAATGPLNSVELLAKFKNPSKKNDRVRIQAISALSSRIKKQTEIMACVSAATFAPVWKKSRGAVQQAAELTRIKVLKEKLVEAGLLHIDEANNEETWRISCRYSTLQKIDLNDLNTSLERLTNEIFTKDGNSLLADEKLQVITTGEFVLFDYVDQQFFRELLFTYATAFALVSLVVLIVLRSPWAMLIALPPNLFPAAVVLGATGHLGYRLDVASLMTASVALGIAVDDTLHFMLWQKKVARQNAESGLHNSNESAFISPIQSALRHCGLAMLQTSVILGSSIVLYAFCGFLPTVRFGILLSTMLFAALIGDLLLLPALAAKFEIKHSVKPDNMDGNFQEPTA